MNHPPHAQPRLSPAQPATILHVPWLPGPNSRDSPWTSLPCFSALPQDWLFFFFSFPRHLQTYDSTKRIHFYRQSSTSPVPVQEVIVSLSLLSVLHNAINHHSYLIARIACYTEAPSIQGGRSQLIQTKRNRERG